MSWNPFNKLIQPRKPTSKLTVDREFEREVARINKMEMATKKLYKDMKRYTESLQGVCKADEKISHDLVNTAVTLDDSLKTTIEKMSDCAEKVDVLKQELGNNTQKMVIEPMKRFYGIFPSVNTAIRRREQSLQDYGKYQAKQQKYSERERTPQNLEKLKAVKSALDTAQSDYQKQNDSMLEEMPKLYDGRIAYFEPCFEALIKSQIKYYSEADRLYEELTQTLANQGTDFSSAENFERQLQTSLSEIRALSIVENTSPT